MEERASLDMAVCTCCVKAGTMGDESTGSRDEVVHDSGLQ